MQSLSPLPSSSCLVSVALHLQFTELNLFSFTPGLVPSFAPFFFPGLTLEMDRLVSGHWVLIKTSDVLNCVTFIQFF
jgi:hypothetical protein